MPTMTENISRLHNLRLAECLPEDIKKLCDEAGWVPLGQYNSLHTHKTIDVHWRRDTYPRKISVVSFNDRELLKARTVAELRHLVASRTKEVLGLILPDENELTGGD